jgi:hypothetical protein
VLDLRLGATVIGWIISCISILLMPSRRNG